jgi:hypothetical protein
LMNGWNNGYMDGWMDQIITAYPRTGFDFLLMVGIECFIIIGIGFIVMMV